MNIELHEFEALGGKFSEEKLIKKGFRYQMYIGLLSIGNAKCIGYVKRMDNGAVIVTRMKNLTENNVVNKLHTVKAVLDHYVEKEEDNEEILMIQSKRKMLTLLAFIFQIDAVGMAVLSVRDYYYVQNSMYLVLAGLGLFVFLLMVECRYRITGSYVLRSRKK